MKRYKVMLIKEYLVTADSEEEAIVSAKFRYDYSNDSSYCAVWDKVRCREYKVESEDNNAEHTYLGRGVKIYKEEIEDVY